MKQALVFFLSLRIYVCLVKMETDLVFAGGGTKGGN